MLHSQQSIKTSLLPFFFTSFSASSLSPSPLSSSLSSSSSPSFIPWVPSRLCGYFIRSRHYFPHRTLPSTSLTTSPSQVLKLFPPTTSPLIDEATQQIHKHMATFTRILTNTGKVDPYTAKFNALDAQLNKEEKKQKGKKDTIQVTKPSLFVGHVVEFAHRGNFEIGFAISSSTSSVSVTMVDNLELTIAPDQISFVWPADVGKISLESFKKMGQDLPLFLDELPMEKRDLADAWKKLCLFAQVPFTSVLLSKIMFNTTSAMYVYATFRMIAASHYFKRWDISTSGYKMYNAAGFKGTSLYNFVKKAQQKLAGADSGSNLLPNWDPTKDLLLKDDIVEFAKLGFNSPARAVATAKFVLQRLEREITPDAAAQLLTDLGAPLIAPGEPNAYTINAQKQAVEISAFVKSIKGEFSQLEDSESLKFRDVDHDNRRDLTNHDVAVIDPSGTLAADTGISMEVSEEGDKAIIYLHVADPTRWLSRNDPISEAAHNVASSTYLTSTVHMLPIELLQSAALADKRENYTLTIELSVNPDNGTLTRSQIYPSIIGRVAKTTYATADNLLAERPVANSSLSKESQAYITSLLQNLTMLKEARMLHAPFQQPIVKPDLKGFSSQEHDNSEAFLSLNYVTVLADEAIAKFADSLSIPLPNPTDFTRPLRSYAGMVTHWQMKAAIRQASTLPYNNAEMVSLREWLGRQNGRNMRDKARLKDEAIQSALRTYYDQQRAIIGKDDVIVQGKILKLNTKDHTASIFVGDFSYKSVLQLNKENFNKVTIGETVLLRLRERPTHIGMSFVGRKPHKATQHFDEQDVSEAIEPQPATKEPKPKTSKAASKLRLAKEQTVDATPKASSKNQKSSVSKTATKSKTKEQTSDATPTASPKNQKSSVSKAATKSKKK